MSAFLDEQAEEKEALEAIYPEEFTVIEVEGEDLPTYSFHLVPDPTGDASSNHIEINLVCKLPTSYPGDEPPIFEVQLVKGLSKKQAGEVRVVAEVTASENLGMASLFTVIESVREWLVDNNVAGQDGSMYADMMRRMNEKGTKEKKAAEKKAVAIAADSEGLEEEIDPEELERIRRRQTGTPVTPESFLAWKKTFEADFAASKLAKGGGPTGRPDSSVSGGGELDMSRPTGKQLFQTNRAGMEDALLAAGEREEASQAIAGALSGLEEGQVAIAEGLFAGEDDDLDFDFDEDEDEDEDDGSYDEDEDEDDGSYDEDDEDE